VCRCGLAHASSPTLYPGPRVVARARNRSQVRNDTDVTAVKISMQVLLVLTSLLLVPLVLLHKGKGGGLSDMFGGGITSSAGSSGVAERNLNRITVGVALVWTTTIVVLGLVERVAPDA
jgi:preprotein translocase subunit SecG